MCLVRMLSSKWCLLQSRCCVLLIFKGPELMDDIGDQRQDQDDQDGLDVAVFERQILGDEDRYQQRTELHDEVLYGFGEFDGMFKDIDGLNEVREDKCDHKAQRVGDEEGSVDKIDVEIGYSDVDRGGDAAGQAITNDLVLQCFLEHCFSNTLRR